MMCFLPLDLDNIFTNIIPFVYQFENFKPNEHLFFVISGGSKGARGTRAPSPGSPNSFNFMQFLGKFCKIVSWRPPWGVGAPPRGNPGSTTGYGNSTVINVGSKRMSSSFGWCKMRFCCCHFRLGAIDSATFQTSPLDFHNLSNT